MDQSVLSLYDILWSASLGLLLLLSIINVSLFFFTKKKSFIYYSFYCIFLCCYLLLFQPELRPSINQLFHYTTTKAYLSNFNWLIQIFFYTFYALFFIHFVELQKVEPKSTALINRFLISQLVILFIIFLILNVVKNEHLFEDIYIYWYTPIMVLAVCIYLPKTLKIPGNIKWIILTGTLFYIISALFTLFFYLNSDLYNLNHSMMIILFIGIIVQNFTIALGLSLQYKNIQRDRANQLTEIDRLDYNQKLVVLKSIARGGQEEQKRIAKSLHNVIGELAAKTLMQFKYAKKIDPEIEQIDSYSRGLGLLESLNDEVQSIAHNIMPKTLLRLGLVNAIQEILEDLTSLDIHFTSTKKTFPLSDQQSYIIYRMVQEMLNNILKHAFATHIYVSLKEINNHFVIIVKDDGVGFDVDNKPAGIGINNLISAANLLDGELEIFSKINKGTSIKITVPLN